MYYKRDLPAKVKGMVQLKLTNVPEGNYLLKITKVGYQSNDAYATYLKLGSPSQLTKAQEQTIKTNNSGAPIVNQVVQIKTDKLFTYDLPLRENDVYLVELLKN